MGLALLLVFLLPGLAGALMSKPFEPTARLAPLRWLVTAGASAVGAALLVSLALDWWVVEDHEREEVLLTEGASGFPIVFVSVGLVACLLVVLGAWGRRNWAPLAFTFLWLLLAVAWWSSTGEPVDSDAVGKALAGLELASWATLAGTVVAVVGSFTRRGERASAPTAGAGPGAPGDSSWSRGRDATAGDVLAAIGLVLVFVLRLFGVLPDALWQLVFLVSIVAVVARARALRAQHRTRARPDRS